MIKRDNELDIQLEKIKGCEDLPIPVSASKYSSGVDLLSAEKMQNSIKAKRN